MNTPEVDFPISHHSYLVCLGRARGGDWSLSDEHDSAVFSPVRVVLGQLSETC